MTNLRRLAFSLWKGQTTGLRQNIEHVCVGPQCESCGNWYRNGLKFLLRQLPHLEEICIYVEVPGAFYRGVRLDGGREHIAFVFYPPSDTFPMGVDE
jgi:hypothetical protein